MPERDDSVDAVGVTHAPAEGESRIVSLVPSITELLFHMGLDDCLVGRTTFCIHPSKQVARVPRVGGTKTVRLEKLRDLEASHVIVNVDENRREDVEAIAEFVPHVIVTHPREPLDNLHLYRLLGHVFRRPKEAERLCASYRKSYGELHAMAGALPRRRVLYLIWRDPWMTISRDTYISRVLALVNWHTACHDPTVRYPEVRFDYELLGDIDIVLFSSEPFPFKAKHLEEARELTGDRDTPFELIDGEMTSWYGSRAIRGLHYLGDYVRRVTPAGGTQGAQSERSYFD